MKKLLTTIAMAGFLACPCVVSAAYIIHLKDGRDFVTEQYSEEGDQIKFERYGGLIGIRKDLVREIEEIEKPPQKKKAAAESQSPQDEAEAVAEDKGNRGLEAKKPSSTPRVSADKPTPDRGGTAEGNADLALYQQAYLEQKSQYEEARKKYWKARRAKHKDEKERALEEMEFLERQLENLKQQVKEKNNGALPEWWK